jgi:hypothetical protein
LSFKQTKTETQKAIRYFAVILILVIFAVGTSTPLKPQHLAAFHMIGMTITIAFVVALYTFAYEDGSTRKAFIIGGIVVAAVVDSLEMLFSMYQQWALVWISIGLWLSYMFAASRST